MKIECDSSPTDCFTVREILPELISQVVLLLSSTEADQQEVGGHHRYV